MFEAMQRPAHVEIWQQKLTPCKAEANMKRCGESATHPSIFLSKEESRGFHVSQCEGKCSDLRGAPLHELAAGGSKHRGQGQHSSLGIA